MNEKLYKTLQQKGEVLNFNVALYNNETDPERTKLAKRVAKQFLEGFARFCEDEGLTMNAGLTQLPELGSSGYVSISKDGHALLFLAVPHEVIEVHTQ